MKEKVVSGIVVRINREGRWSNVDLSEMTEEEMRWILYEKNADQLHAWSMGLMLWIRAVVAQSNFAGGDCGQSQH